MCRDDQCQSVVVDAFVSNMPREDAIIRGDVRQQELDVGIAKKGAEVMVSALRSSLFQSSTNSLERGEGLSESMGTTTTTTSDISFLGDIYNFKGRELSDVTPGSSRKGTSWSRCSTTDVLRNEVDDTDLSEEKPTMFSSGDDRNLNSVRPTLSENNTFFSPAVSPKRDEHENLEEFCPREVAEIFVESEKDPLAVVVNTLAQLPTPQRVRTPKFDSEEPISFCLEYNDSAELAVDVSDPCQGVAELHVRVYTEEEDIAEVLADLPLPRRMRCPKFDLRSPSEVNVTFCFDDEYDLPLLLAPDTPKEADDSLERICRNEGRKLCRVSEHELPAMIRVQPTLTFPPTSVGALDHED